MALIYGLTRIIDGRFLDPARRCRAHKLKCFLWSRLNVPYALSLSYIEVERRNLYYLLLMCREQFSSGHRLLDASTLTKSPTR